MGFFNFPHTRSYDTDLGWLIKTVTSYQDAIDTLNNWIESAEPRLEDLEACCAALESGDLPAGVAEGITKWLQENAVTWLSAIIKNVWFGLTDSGYFVAYVPDSWSDIIFKTTGLDISIEFQPEYGHLVLQY